VRLKHEPEQTFEPLLLFFIHSLRFLRLPLGARGMIKFRTPRRVCFANYVRRGA
jgi:hypothetical protein